jgi:hypothetical protein
MTISGGKYARVRQFTDATVDVFRIGRNSMHSSTLQERRAIAIHLKRIKPFGG